MNVRRWRPTLISPARIKVLIDAPARPDARHVLYWMQQSQRAAYNPALEYAIEEANALDLPVLVYFGLTAFPEANARHYDFMLRGLAEVEEQLRARGVGFVIRETPLHELAEQLADRGSSASSTTIWTSWSPGQLAGARMTSHSLAMSILRMSLRSWPICGSTTRLRL